MDSSKYQQILQTNCSWQEAVFYNGSIISLKIHLGLLQDEAFGMGLTVPWLQHHWQLKLASPETRRNLVRGAQTFAHNCISPKSTDVYVTRHPQPKRTRAPLSIGGLHSMEVLMEEKNNDFGTVWEYSAGENTPVLSKTPTVYRTRILQAMS